ncbi:MAG: TasA family protein [Coriobacteriia bacterium]
MLRKILFAAIGAVAALAIGSAGAYFTTQLQLPDNVIRAGTVAVSTEPTSTPLALDGLAPGLTVARTMSVVNDGTLPCDVSMTAQKKAGITAFYDALTVRVSCAGTSLYDGSLSAMKTTALRIAPGANAEVKFEVGLPSTAGNDLAGDYAKVSLYVDAEQVH